MRNLFPDLSLADYFTYVYYGVGPSYRPEDCYAANLLSSLGALDAGITQILDFSHIQNTPAHADACIAGLRDSGIRAVFGYGYPTNGTAQWWVNNQSKYPDDILRVQKQYFSSTDQLLTLALAASGPGSCPDDITLKQWKIAREAGVRISVHAGSGSKRGFYEPFAKVPGFFQPDTTYIHCNAFSELEWKLVAESGGTVSISPGTEMPMGHGLPATQAALDHGIRPSLSVDVETTEPGDFFTTIRLTLYGQREQINLRSLAEREEPSEVADRARRLGTRDDRGRARQRPRSQDRNADSGERCRSDHAAHRSHQRHPAQRRRRRRRRRHGHEQYRHRHGPRQDGQAQREARRRRPQSHRTHGDGVAKLRACTRPP